MGPISSCVHFSSKMKEFSSFRKTAVPPEDIADQAHQREPEKCSMVLSFEFHCCDITLKKSKWQCRDREERKLEKCQPKDTESKEGPEIQERGS